MTSAVVFFNFVLLPCWMIVFSTNLTGSAPCRRTGGPGGDAEGTPTRSTWAKNVTGRAQGWAFDGRRGAPGCSFSCGTAWCTRGRRRGIPCTGARRRSTRSCLCPDCSCRCSPCSTCRSVRCRTCAAAAAGMCTPCLLGRGRMPRQRQWWHGVVVSERPAADPGWEPIRPGGRRGKGGDSACPWLCMQLSSQC